MTTKMYCDRCGVEINKVDTGACAITYLEKSKTFTQGGNIAPPQLKNEDICPICTDKMFRMLNTIKKEHKSF